MDTLSNHVIFVKENSENIQYSSDNGEEIFFCKEKITQINRKIVRWVVEFLFSINLDESLKINTG